MKKIFLILFFISLSNIALADNCKGIWVDKSIGFAFFDGKKAKVIRGMV